jgi:hypothetical protein
VADGTDTDFCEVGIGEVFEQAVGDGVGIEGWDVHIQGEFAE